MKERRAHPRTVIHHRVRLIHPVFGETVTTTCDMSNGGFFIELSGVPFPEVGSMIKIQLLDTPIAAMVNELQVVRVTDTGIGVAFNN